MFTEKIVKQVVKHQVVKQVIYEFIL